MDLACHRAIQDAGAITEMAVSDSPVSSFSEPVVLWRLRHPDGDAARATFIPGSPQSTLVYFVNDRFERGENVTEWEHAVRQAEDVRQRMVGEGWREEGG
jgi:hypothetical protein